MGYVVKSDVEIKTRPVTPPKPQPPSNDMIKRTGALKKAIEEAKEIREQALKNAKQALEVAFGERSETPDEKENRKRYKGIDLQSIIDELEDKKEEVEDRIDAWRANKSCSIDDMWGKTGLLATSGSVDLSDPAVLIKSNGDTYIHGKLMESKLMSSIYSPETFQKVPVPTENDSYEERNRRITLPDFQSEKEIDEFFDNWIRFEKTALRSHCQHEQHHRHLNVTVKDHLENFSQCTTCGAIFNRQRYDGMPIE
jgi:hypothetical protein